MRWDEPVPGWPAAGQHSFAYRLVTLGGMFGLSDKTFSRVVLVFERDQPAELSPRRRRLAAAPRHRRGSCWRALID